MMTGNARPLPRPQPDADFEPKHARQHPIEYEEVWRRGGKAQLGIVAALDALRDVAFRVQIVGEQKGNVSVVFDNEDAGCG